jgi:hypothetical protein
MAISRQSIPKPIRRFLRAGFSRISEPVMYTRGYLRARDLKLDVPTKARNGASNPLREYFESYRRGPGIFKWQHYFEIYHRHFQKFIGRSPKILEIGIYSGGSLAMWNHYFGEGSHIYGVDIQPECLAYKSESVSVLIGDQGDRTFWNTVKQTIPFLDVIIDDGSHFAEDQIATFEQVLPHLNAGGVYLCEDIHGTSNRFGQYINGFMANLNAGELNHEDHRISSPATPFQAAIHSVHLYPYVVVVEKTEATVCEFVAPKHGTEWQPFLGPTTKREMDLDSEPAPNSSVEMPANGNRVATKRK